MSLAAEDIQTQQFHVRFRGFDVDEVDSFLDRVAENYALIVDDKKQLTEKLEKLEKEIKNFHSQEKTFQHAIISAQRITEEMQEKSRRESEERIAAAQEEVSRIREEARLEKEILQKEIAELQESRNKVKEELRSYLQNYLDRLDDDTLLHEMAPMSLLHADIHQHEKETEEPEPEYETQEKAAADDDDNLDDLYEKIDLPDDTSLYDSDFQEDETEEQMARALKESEPFTIGESGDDDELTMPDLEGDMLFSLEDPLDEDHDLDVAIDPMNDKKLK